MTRGTLSCVLALGERRHGNGAGPGRRNGAPGTVTGGARRVTVRAGSPPARGLRTLLPADGATRGHIPGVRRRMGRMQYAPTELRRVGHLRLGDRAQVHAADAAVGHAV